LRHGVLGWVTVWAKVKDFGVITNTKINSAFHLCGVSKSSIDSNLFGWGQLGCIHMCRVTGNTVWSHMQVRLRSCSYEMDFPWRAVYSLPVSILTKGGKHDVSPVRLSLSVAVTSAPASINNLQAASQPAASRCHANHHQQQQQH